MRVTRLELVQDLDCVAGMRETNEDDEPTTSVSTEIEELLWTPMDKHLTGLAIQTFAWILRCVLSHKQIHGRTNRLQHTIPTTTEYHVSRWLPSEEPSTDISSCVWATSKDPFGCNIQDPVPEPEIAPQ